MLVELSSKFIPMIARPVISQIERFIKHDPERKKIIIDKTSYGKLLNLAFCSNKNKVVLKYKGVLIECA
jgi:hypothetical protein